MHYLLLKEKWEQVSNRWINHKIWTCFRVKNLRGNNEISLRSVGITTLCDRADVQNYPNIRLPTDRHIEGIFTRTVALSLGIINILIFGECYSSGGLNGQTKYSVTLKWQKPTSLASIKKSILYVFLTIPRSDSKSASSHQARMSTITVYGIFIYFFTRL